MSKYLVNGKDIKNFVYQGTTTSTDISGSGTTYYNSFPGSANTETNSIAKMYTGMFTYSGSDVANSRSLMYTDYTTSGAMIISPPSGVTPSKIRVICVGGCGGGGGAAGGKRNNTGPDQYGGSGGGGGGGGISYSSSDITYSSPMSIFVGTGGYGGLGGSGGVAGSAGKPGKESWIGDERGENLIVIANGGGGGGGGAVATGNGNAGSAGLKLTGDQGAGGSAGTGNTNNGNAGTGGVAGKSSDYNSDTNAPRTEGSTDVIFSGSSTPSNIAAKVAGTGGNCNGRGTGGTGNDGGNGATGMIRIYWLP